MEFLLRDELSDDVIAAQLKINPRTLHRWKHEPDFADALAAGTQAIAAELRAEGIANKQNRIDAQVDRWNDLETIRQERANDPQIAKFPGGKTGFITAALKQVKHVKPGDDETGEQVWMEEFWEHAFDAPLWNAYLAIEKHTGQETGDFQEKINLSGSLKREYIIIADGDE